MSKNLSKLTSDALLALALDDATSGEDRTNAVDILEKRGKVTVHRMGSAPLDYKCRPEAQSPLWSPSDGNADSAH